MLGCLTLSASSEMTKDNAEQFSPYYFSTYSIFATGTYWCSVILECEQIGVLIPAFLNVMTASIHVCMLKDFYAKFHRYELL